LGRKNDQRLGFIVGQHVLVDEIFADLGGCTCKTNERREGEENVGMRAGLHVLGSIMQVWLGLLNMWAEWVGLSS